jgi:hypothetical protein
MTDSEKTLVQNWAYWLAHHCVWDCKREIVKDCEHCSIPNIRKQMEEEVERKGR